MEMQLKETPEFMSMLEENGCHCMNTTSVHVILPELLRSRGEKLFYVYTNTFLRRKMWQMNAFQRGRLASFQVRAKA